MSAWLWDWVRGYWHKVTEVRDKRKALSVPAWFLKGSSITVALRQRNYKHLPCRQSFTRHALMDVSHTGDNMLLSPRHLSPFYLGLSWQPQRAVMLMTVGSACPRGLSGRNKTNAQWGSTEQLAPNNPNRHDLAWSKWKRWHIRTFQHINALYSHTEVTENTLWHTPAQLSMRMTSESQLREMSSPSARRDNTQLQ